MRSQFLAILAIALPLALQSDVSLGDETSRQSIDSYVIFTDSQLALFAIKMDRFGVYGPYWTPSKFEVNQALESLKNYLIKRKTTNTSYVLDNIGDYIFQYVGYTEKNQKTIFINGLCRGMSGNEDHWKTKFIGIYDGGNCYFNAQFDVQSKSIVGTSINIS